MKRVFVVVCWSLSLTSADAIASTGTLSSAFRNFSNSPTGVKLAVQYVGSSLV